MSSKRLNYHQLQHLLHVMENHSFLSKRQITKMGAQGDDINEEMWLQLSVQLNILASDNKRYEKSLEQFKKIWNDMKLEAKEIMLTYLENEAQTGNVNNDIVLDNTTKRISAIFGKHGTGAPLLHEFGADDPNEFANPIDFFDKIYSKKLDNDPYNACDFGILNKSESIPTNTIFYNNNAVNTTETPTDFSQLIDNTIGVLKTKLCQTIEIVLNLQEGVESVNI